MEHTAFHGGVAVDDGKISQLVAASKKIEVHHVINLEGCVLLPGIVDDHVHFSPIGREYEGYSSGTKSAAAGGITTVLDMPLNDLPPTTDRATLF